MTTSTTELADTIDTVDYADETPRTIANAAATIDGPRAVLSRLTKQLHAAAATAQGLAGFQGAQPWVDPEEPHEPNMRPLPLSQHAASNLRGAEQDLLMLAEAADAALAAITERYTSIEDDLHVVRVARASLIETRD